MRLLGLLVVGPGKCRDTNVVREFLYKNFVPFTWFDPETEEGARVFQSLGSPKKTPVIGCGDGSVLINPSLIELARGRGDPEVLLPAQDVDFAIGGGRPRGHCGGRVRLFRGAFDFDARSFGGQEVRRAGRLGSENPSVSRPG